MKFFDLRLPLGWLFAVLGFLLVIAGLSGSGSGAAELPAVPGEARWLGVNVIWGGVMICFGLLCLWLARREGRRREQSDHRSPER